MRDCVELEVLRGLADADPDVVAEVLAADVVLSTSASAAALAPPAGRPASIFWSGRLELPAGRLWTVAAGSRLRPRRRGAGCGRCWSSPRTATAPTSGAADAAATTPPNTATPANPASRPALATTQPAADANHPATEPVKPPTVPDRCRASATTTERRSRTTRTAAPDEANR